ncbi:class I SAM-dependent methyltransferase [Synechocystis sp. LKSZ1]|uniref:class I SAM-dependent methyltransferase n=1 Tax=Synechocystis sp. LKSZ1 TaxID=3144951 RepID=UPI00336BEFAF
MSSPPIPASAHKALLQALDQAPAQRFTFAEFMDWVLYHPVYGYYSRGRVAIGVQGDFVTSASLGPDFGELLAVQFQEMWQILGCPSSFNLLEMGAGTGNLAYSILNFIKENYPAFWLALDYQIIEISPGLKIQQRQTLQAFLDNVRWAHCSEIADQSLVGCCFSNELVDAFPVHRVIRHQGQLKEIYVTAQAGQLIEIIDNLSTPQLSLYFQELGIDLTAPEYPEDYCTEVNLQARSWLQQVAPKLDRGYILTIDYGYSAQKYYHPQRYQGTLQCYYQQRYHADPYLNLGEQDITSHVNFTALEQWGKQCSLESLGGLPQSLFLMNLGLGERLANLSNSDYSLPELLQRREQLHQLIDPVGLGKFWVLLQGKNLEASSYSASLRGLQNFDILPTI